jgi:hypothetical protein
MVIAQSALALGAHPAFPGGEKDSALVALPAKGRLAEERRHYTRAKVCDPLQDVPGLRSTGEPIWAASMHTIRR